MLVLVYIALLIGLRRLTAAGLFVSTYTQAIDEVNHVVVLILYESTRHQYRSVGRAGATVQFVKLALPLFVLVILLNVLLVDIWIILLVIPWADKLDHTNCSVLIFVQSFTGVHKVAVGLFVLIITRQILE